MEWPCSGSRLFTITFLKLELLGIFFIIPLKLCLPLCGAFPFQDLVYYGDFKDLPKRLWFEKHRNKEIVILKICIFSNFLLFSFLKYRDFMLFVISIFVVVKENVVNSKYIFMLFLVFFCHFLVYLSELC